MLQNVLIVLLLYEVIQFCLYFTLTKDGVKCNCICRATRMEEDPKVTLDIQCLWQGGGVALTLTYNYFLHQRGSGGTWAITV